MIRFAVVLAFIACSRREPAPAGSGSGSGSAPVAALGADAREDERFDPGALGALHFALSRGSDSAKAHFQRGMLAMHSFWYDEAAREFGAAMGADPQMDMAYWGYAMAHLKLLWGEDDLGVARDTLSQMPNPDRLSEREQAWVLAAVALVKAPDVRSSRRAFAQAMAALHARFPDDESTTFLALARLAELDPAAPDANAKRIEVGALADTVYQRNPKHPGAAHYAIHAFDTPSLAKRGLPYAETYAKTAPAAYHARHMPAHIFFRLGMWDEAIASCRAAWDASLAAARRAKLSANHHDFHSLAWLVELYFEVGKPAMAARTLADFGAAVQQGLGRAHRAAYATEVASYMARSEAWDRLDELLAPLRGPVIDEAARDLRSGSGSHCAPQPPLALVEELAVLETRLLAASMRRDGRTTVKLLAEADRVRTALRPTLVATRPDELARLDAAWGEKRELARARAAGETRKLAALLEKAANKREVATSEFYPTAFVPSEELADLLAQDQQLAAARVMYERTLATHPRRAHALRGLARVARALGDTAAATATYATLREVWRDAEPGLRDDIE